MVLTSNRTKKNEPNTNLFGSPNRTFRFRTLTVFVFIPPPPMFLTWKVPPQSLEPELFCSSIRHFRLGNQFLSNAEDCCRSSYQEGVGCTVGS